MRLRFLIPVLLSATVAVAQDSPSAEPAPTAVAVVPVVGNMVGYAQAHWKADVTIVNDTGGSVDVAVELPSAPESPAIFLSLEPGQAQRFGDLMGQAFAMDGVISPLRITTSGRRSVSVSTSIYAVTANGLSAMQPVVTYYGPSWFPTRILDGLAFSDSQRTNIGLVNLGNDPAEFTLGLQRIAGRTLAVVHVRVGPQQIYQQAIQTIFPLITQGTGFSIVVETSASDTFAYGSVIENSSQAGKFIAPRIGF